MANDILYVSTFVFVISWILGWILLFITMFFQKILPQHESQIEVLLKYCTVILEPIFKVYLIIIVIIWAIHFIALVASSMGLSP
jgi:succinate dehydrogenase/fumarate reductase cytochrome b subunit